jgi:hypothetical protein
MSKENRNHQIYTWHTNGDERIYAWFTYEGALKKIDEIKYEEPTLSCYEITLDNQTVENGSFAHSLLCRGGMFARTHPLDVQQLV